MQNILLTTDIRTGAVIRAITLGNVYYSNESEKPKKESKKESREIKRDSKGRVLYRHLISCPIAGSTREFTSDYSLEYMIGRIIGGIDSDSERKKRGLRDVDFTVSPYDVKICDIEQRRLYKHLRKDSDSDEEEPSYLILVSRDEWTFRDRSGYIETTALYTLKIYDNMLRESDIDEALTFKQINLENSIIKGITTWWGSYEAGDDAFIWCGKKYSVPEDSSSDYISDESSSSSSSDYW